MFNYTPFQTFMMMNQMGTQMMLQFMEFSMKQMTDQMNMMSQMMNQAQGQGAPQTPVPPVPPPPFPPQFQPQPQNKFSMGGFNFSPADLQKLMKLEASPEQLNMLQKGLDFIFDSYTKKKK